MTTFHHTAAIILAAGSSTRMGGGRHKLLLPLHNRPVLAHVLDAVLASQARPVVLVLGHQAEQVRSHLATYASYPDLSIIENPDYLQGMSTSMRLGIQTLQIHGYMKSSNGEIDSALVLPGDQPLITAQDIDALIAAYRMTGKRIIAPLYEGKRGNPVLFNVSLFPELLEVTGDEGGRSVLARHRDEIAAVEMGNPLANIDVDTWEAYQRVVEVWEQKR
ncbi:MAG TPA: nucleotidyltransferase family protein [Ktedonobacteraceae bacterium]|nr:nucleotidyltransferase family protein [Ktedonobacteraceae bacterium]